MNDWNRCVRLQKLSIQIKNDEYFRYLDYTGKCQMGCQQSYDVSYATSMGLNLFVTERNILFLLDRVYWKYFYT